MWEKSFEIRKELICDRYVIMPNHIHGIIIIDDNDDVDVETHGRASLHKSQHNGVAIRIPQSVSSFIAGFKSAATKQINIFRGSPGVPIWQSRFYDHIVRNENDLNRIRKYIINNPINWISDQANPAIPNRDARPCVSTNKKYDLI